MSKKAAEELSKADAKRRALARRVRQSTVEDFHDELVRAGVERAYVVWENGELTLSHPRLLAPLGAFLELSRDFAGHEAIFIGREEGIPTLFFAVVHDTRRGLAQGGLRFKPYASLAEVLVDNLRLAQGMTRKNALAGLWWGGGKGVLPMTRGLDTPAHRQEGSPERLALFRAYGRFIASLGGVYYTAEDIGTKTSDMNALLSQNRFTTCIGTEYGGSGNPSPFTARGVFRGMQAAWQFLHGTDDLAGVRVAVQGTGNVGTPLIEELDAAGARVWASDLDRQALAALKKRLPRVEIVENGDDIYDLEVDVLAPCAVGAVVNQHTVPRLKVELVCGAANNILARPADGERLRERGIAFVPDYLCNRMGITNCCDESIGYLQDDVELAAERVYPDTLRVLRHARRLDITPSEAADQLADLAACELHPLFGHRGRRIIDHLIASDWAGTRKRKIDGVPNLFQPPRDEPGIRVRWEREGRFRGDGPAIAAAPIPASARPELSSFLSAVLMDVRARATTAMGGKPLRRFIGSDPGGLALQLAAERGLSYESAEIGRSRFVEYCRDLYRQHDEAVRQQLHGLGVGFDPRHWLEAMSLSGARVTQRLYLALEDSGWLAWERRRGYFDAVSQTLLLAPGEASVETIRGRRTAELEDRGVAEHLFVHLEEPARHLERAIERGAVTFSDQRFRERVLESLVEPEPWSISRQQWWGQPIPGRDRDDHGDHGEDSEVFSVWLTLAAWTLQALGWPRRAAPEPIAEVIVDPDLLMRWVVPSQMLALHLGGRPAFRHIEVHGALHVPVRALEEISGQEHEERDEERFIVRRKRQLMRRQLGNLAEPVTLVRRFGADALRLGYLLSLNPGSPEVASLAESNLRTARRAVQRLNAKVTGLQRLAGGVEPRPEALQELDRDFLTRLGERVDEVFAAYRERRFYDAGQTFVAVVGEVARYTGKAARRRDASGLGATATGLAAMVEELERGFAPIAPYLLEKLRRTVLGRAKQL